MEAVLSTHGSAKLRRAAEGNVGSTVSLRVVLLDLYRKAASTEEDDTCLAYPHSCRPADPQHLVPWQTYI